jgi:hypothetical protein
MQVDQVKAGVSRGRAEIRVYRGAWWLPITLGLGIPVLLVAGIFIFTVLMTIGLLLLLFRRKSTNAGPILSSSKR